jgi:hypothetical protein
LVEVYRRDLAKPIISIYVDLDPLRIETRRCRFETDRDDTWRRDCKLISSIANLGWELRIQVKDFEWL